MNCWNTLLISPLKQGVEDRRIYWCFQLKDKKDRFPTINFFKLQIKEQDNQHQFLSPAFDWLINKDIYEIYINPQYAESISFMRSNKARVHQVEPILTTMLKTNNLEISKHTKKVLHQRKEQKQWITKCKYLRSWINTAADKLQRKVLITKNYNILKNFLKSKYLLEKLNEKFSSPV